MSRALNLSLTIAQVDDHCRKHGVAISALERLPDGGARLVCMSNYGAAQIRSKLKGHIIEGEVRRERFRPVKPMWQVEAHQCPERLSALSAEPAVVFTAQYFHDRARDCRALAKSARNDVDATMLEDLAFDLEDEAGKIDAEEARKRPANEP